MTNDFQPLKSGDRFLWSSWRDGHTHLYLYNQMPGVYPLWFDEGLAMMMGRAMYTGTQVEIYPAQHGDEGGWVSTDRILRATKSSPEYLSQKQLYSLHFQSHAMVYRALIDDTEFGKQVFKYLEAVNNLATPEEAEAAIKADLADLTRGKHKGRMSEDEVTLFKSVGTAIEDFAAARLAMRRRKS